MLLHRAWLVAFVVVGALFAVGCPRLDGSCRNDVDCTGNRSRCDTFSGVCVECTGAGECAGDAFCCGGTCTATVDVDKHCGCSPVPTSRGDDCTALDLMCLVQNEPAAAVNAIEGECGCPCTPEQGGALCVGKNGDGSFQCGCDQNADLATCGKPALDAEGALHIVADLCLPTGTCGCFGTGTPSTCDPLGAAPDCTASGCLALKDDAANCGVQGNVCADLEGDDVEGGRCEGGGCRCVGRDSCKAGEGTTGNVDTCAFLQDDFAQCVCAAFTADGVVAACPLGLACKVDGCELDAVRFTTAEALHEALLQRGQPGVDAGPASR
jgi:hypothetical protein